MQYFVYIGRHNKTIELFSKLSTGVFYAAPNCYKATKVLDKIREKYAAALFIRGYWQVQDADIKICFSSDYSRANIVATKNEQVITFVLERKEYRDDEKAPDMLY